MKFFHVSLGKIILGPRGSGKLQNNFPYFQCILLKRGEGVISAQHALCVKSPS